MKSPSWYRSKRLASSVLLPWLLGLVSLLSLAGSIGFLGGRVDSGLVVPTAVLDAQQASTDSAAQQIRRGLNAGLQDVAQLASGLGLAERPGDLEPYLKDFAGRYKRYRSVYLLDAGRKVIARTGGEPHPDKVPDRQQQPGMTNAVKIDSVPVVVQHAPAHLRDKRVVTLAAEYDVSYLRGALDGVRPATVWVVNTDGQVVASTAGFTAFQKLDTDELRQAAARAHDGSGVAGVGGSRSAKDIVAYAPVHGAGPASALAWGVVTSRSVNTVALPQTQARRQALLFSLVLGALTAIIFGWLVVMFVRPLRGLVGEAERLAGGDLSAPVEVRRYDEIGLVGRALERMRVRVIQEATRQRPAAHSPSTGRPAAAAASPIGAAALPAGAADDHPTAPRPQVVSTAPSPDRQEWGR